MSFLGKILIVIQVIMSILFMCAAGAVFALHRDWRAQHTAATGEINRLQSDAQNEAEELNKRIDGLTEQLQTATNERNAVVGENGRLTAEVASLTDELTKERRTVALQTGVAVSKTDESRFRQSEAEQQRERNAALHDQLEDVIAENRQLADQVYNLTLANEELDANVKSLLERNSFVEKVLRQADLEFDPRDIASLSEPPPPVDGLVVAIQKDRTNRTKFAHISIGEDDGIRIGHELDVYRPAEQNNGDVKYLGRIRIIHITPDEAVGIVVQAAKNGIIERGDNVTTKI